MMAKYSAECCMMLTVYFLISYNLFNYLFYVQPTPFIDEIFHVPQGLKYCQGNFSEWDPKITTLPGLYIITFGLLQLFEQITSFSMCTTYNLRFFNVVCSSIILFLLQSVLTYHINYKKNKSLEIGHKRLALWTAFNIAIFPVSYFFSFFFYTEALSTLFFLLIYRLHLSQRFWSAAVVGVCSVLVRQTNIIWVGYFLVKMGCMKLSQIKFCLKDIFKLEKVLHLLSSPIWIKLLYDAMGYLITCLLFVIFIYVNGGIVVGDKSAHQPALHLCQLFYFSLFCIVFTFPHFIFRLKGFFKIIKNNVMVFLLCLLAGCLVVYNFTMVHPYLLADNRHYSFYVWQRLYSKYKVLRYILLPVYYFGFYFINKSLEKKTVFAFWLCCLMCLVPQKLFEFRYFILPFILFRLQLKCETWWVLAIESFFFICVNLFTFYIFVTKEFYWSDSKDIQRIIW